MKEKKKISVTTYVLSVIAVALMLTLVIILVVKNNEKEKELEVQPVTSNSSQTIQEVVKDDNVVENQENEVNIEEISKLAEDTLKKYSKLEKYKNLSIGPMPNLLSELGLATAEELEEETTGIRDSKTYIKSKTKYEDFKNEMLKYMTEEYFNKNYSQYKNMDGYVGFCNCAGGVPSTSYLNLKYVKENENLYEFTVTLRDEEVYENSNNEKYDFDYKAVFEYVNGRMVLSSLEAM